MSERTLFHSQFETTRIKAREPLGCRIRVLISLNKCWSSLETIFIWKWVTRDYSKWKRKGSQLWWGFCRSFNYWGEWWSHLESGISLGEVLGKKINTGLKIMSVFEMLGNALPNVLLGYRYTGSSMITFNLGKKGEDSFLWNEPDLCSWYLEDAHRKKMQDSHWS